METQALPPIFHNESLIPTDFNTCTEGLFDLSTPIHYSEETILDMRERFIRKGYVKLDRFLSQASLRLLQSELGRLHAVARDKNFQMPGYETPRKLKVLGGSDIRELSPLLYRIYHHHAIKACVEGIVGRSVFRCTHPEEYMVANFLGASGDTHGWHLDDPAFALVIFIEAPTPGEGGELEVVPNWDLLCDRKGFPVDRAIQTMLGWARDNNLVEHYVHLPGDAYLLRADRNLHRVTPLESEDASRAVINMAYQAAPTTLYKATANYLYGY